MKKLIAALVLALGSISLTATAASAHTATFSADCDGVVIHAVSYDGNRDNRWSVTVGGVTQSGTFGSSYDATFPVPQGGATTHWSALVEAEDGGYHSVDSGDVGPCGTPPVVQPARAWFRVVAYCNTVRVEGRHHIARITHTRFGHRGHRFVAHAATGATFRDGSTVKVERAWTKRGCHSGS